MDDAATQQGASEEFGILKLYKPSLRETKPCDFMQQEASLSKRVCAMTTAALF